MGIHGLTSFIDNNPHLLKDHHLHDSRVVIDGNNFYHFLYFYCNVCFQFGGDYDTFQRKTAMIFSLFRSCNIESYVVFDGAYTLDGRKHKTTISRARDRMYAAQRIVNGGRGVLIPCLAQMAFRQTLDMLGVKHVTCDFEADNQIVTLANHLNCPVISNDSDFYIFDLSHGFIPLDYIDFRLAKFPGDAGNQIESYTFLPVQFYHVDEFIHCFKSLNRSVLPLFATMLGNDYVDATAFEIFYNKKTPKSASRRYSASKKHTKIVSVLYWLEEKGNVEEVLPEVMTFIKKDQLQKVEKLLNDSIKGYVETQDFESFNLKKFLEGNREAALQRTDLVKGFDGSSLHSWFLHGVRCGDIPAFILNVILLHRIILPTQVENISMPASFLTSLSLRRIMYGILLNQEKAAAQAEGKDGRQPPQTTAQTHLPYSASQDNAAAIEEYTRHNLELRKILVEPCYSLKKYGDLPTLETIPQLSVGDQQAIIKESLGISGGFLSKFEPPMQLFAMSVVFWIKNASPSIMFHHLRAVFMSVILLHVHKELRVRENRLLGLGDEASEKTKHHAVESNSETANKENGHEMLPVNIAGDMQDDESAQTDESDNAEAEKECSPKRKYGSAFLQTCGQSSGVHTEQDVLSITAICQSLSDKVLQKVRDNLNKYYKEPVKISTKVPPDHPVFHGTAQLLACLHDSSHLNSLLRCPFPSLQPSVLFNGTFVYSMAHELQNRTNPDLFLQEMLVKSSPLAALLDSLCSVFLAEVGDGFLSEQKAQGTKCCKKAKKKKKMTVNQGQNSQHKDSATDDGKSREDLVAACDLSNRFGVLMMEELEDA